MGVFMMLRVSPHSEIYHSLAVVCFGGLTMYGFSRAIFYRNTQIKWTRGSGGQLRVCYMFGLSVSWSWWMWVCMNRVTRHTRAESHRGGDKRKHLGPDRELAEERALIKERDRTYRRALKFSYQDVSYKGGKMVIGSHNWKSWVCDPQHCCCVEAGE